MFSLLLAHLLTSAQADPGALAVQHHVLDNGLQVILAPDPRAPSAHVNVWYHVGAADESPGLTGFAHLFEHLMFQGSPSAPDEYFGPLEAVGASINGTTSSDRTNYFETVPPEYLPLALFLESDRMGWLLDTLDQERLDNQRDVVRNERRQRYEDRPYGTAWMELMALLYPTSHPYHHAPIGSHEDLERASLEDVQGFFRTWYGPDNASLALTGNFDPDEALALVKRWFGPIPARGATPRSEGHLPRPVSPRETIARHVTEDVPQPRLYLAWPTPAAFQAGDAEVRLLADVLSGGRESRLDQALVHQGRIATSVTAYATSNRLASHLVVVATPAPGHTTEEIARVIDAEIAALIHTAPPTTEELEAARAAVERERYTALTRIGQLADLLNRYNLLLGTPDGLERDLARFADLDAEALQEAARVWLAGPRVELHITPPDPKGAVSDPTWASLRTEPLPAPAHDEEAP